MTLGREPGEAPRRTRRSTQGPWLRSNKKTDFQLTVNWEEWGGEGWGGGGLAEYGRQKAGRPVVTLMLPTQMTDDGSLNWVSGHTDGEVEGPKTYSRATFDPVFGE